MAKKKAKARGKKAPARRAKVTARARKKTTAMARRVARKPAAARRLTATRPASGAPANPARALAKRIVDLTIAGDDAASFALYAGDVESVEMGMPPTVGIEAIKQKFAGWHSIVSNANWTAHNVWVDGNTIVIEWHGTVTLAASGKVAEMREIAIHEVANGRIVRERFYYNPAALQP